MLVITETLGALSLWQARQQLAVLCIAKHLVTGEVTRGSVNSQWPTAAGQSMQHGNR